MPADANGPRADRAALVRSPLQVDRSRKPLKLAVEIGDDFVV